MSLSFVKIKKNDISFDKITHNFIICFDDHEGETMKIICIKAPKFMSGFLKVIFKKYYIKYQ